MSRLVVEHQSAGDGVGSIRLHQHTTFDAFDLHGFLLDDSIPYRPQLPGLPRSPDSVFAWLRPSNAMAVNSPLRSEIVPQALTVVARVGFVLAILHGLVASPHVGAGTVNVRETVLGGELRRSHGLLVPPLTPGIGRNRHDGAPQVARRFRYREPWRSGRGVPVGLGDLVGLEHHL